MRQVTAFFIFLLFTLSAFSQSAKPSMTFKALEHDFGTIKEQDGKVSYTFTFVNTGGSALLIQNVTSTCGCTTPDWTREPVAPGASGIIEVTYNPAGRPGAFRKYINVVNNGEPSNVRLMISGEVTPKPISIEDEYRYGMGVLRLKSNHLSFGNIKNTETKQSSVEVVNNSDQPLKIEFEQVPAFLKVEAKPASLAPGQKGVITASYNAQERKDWGFQIDRVAVKINGVSERDFRLVVSANIEEDFSSYTPEQLANAPVLKVDNPEFNFGTLKQGDRVDYEFTLSNTGKSELLIRSIKASCGCTAVQPEKKVIAPGESIKLKVIFNSAGKKGTQNKTVTLICNDPKNSKAIFWIKGTVTE